MDNVSEVPNMQQIFETIINHLLNQKVRSMKPRKQEDGNMCAYRGDNGTSCAIGCLIPEEEYNSKMENNSVSAMFRLFPNVASRFVGIPITFLEDMQDLHDNTVDGFTMDNESFVKRIDLFCVSWGLNNVWK